MSKWFQTQRAAETHADELKSRWLYPFIWFGRDDATGRLGWIVQLPACAERSAP